jgi:hypothetical protein
MSWKALVVNRAVQPHKTSVKEIKSIRNLVNRDLPDAAIEGSPRIGVLRLLTT